MAVLLHQPDWEGEFDLLCDLLAHAAVVYMDETGWKVGSEGCSLWAFHAAPSSGSVSIVILLKP
jgi:hypothetical protein